jgi:hypothetical protein
MSSIPFETFLARLFADAKFREDFLRDPRRVVETQGFGPHEQAQALAIDRAGLVLAARSFAAKRADKKDGPRRALRMWRRITNRGGADYDA